MRILLYILLCALPWFAEGAAARPFTVDDLLAVEQFSQTLIDPSGRWLVIERRGAAGSAPRFDLETHKALTLGRLLVVDLDRPSVARPLLPAEADTGYVAWAFSPRGSRLAVVRLHDRSWELGVVTLATGTVRWLGITPGLPVEGRAIQWRSEDELLAISHQGSDLPIYLRAGWQGMADLPKLWEKAALGNGATATPVGSGRFRSVTPKAAPRHLIRIDVRNGRGADLAEGDLLDFELSPDGRHVAVIEAGGRVQPAAAESVGVATSDWRQRLMLIDIAGQPTRAACVRCDVAGSLLRWSPSGRTLLFFARTDGSDWSGADFLSVDAKTGKTVRLTGDALRPVIEGPPNFPPVARADWMGEEPIVYASSVSKGDEASRADWYRISGVGPVALTSRLANAAPGLLFVTPSMIGAMSEGQAWQIDANGDVAPVNRSNGIQPIAAASPSGGNRERINARASEPAFAGWRRQESRVEVEFFGRTEAAVEIETDRTTVPRITSPKRAAVVVEQTDAHGSGRLVLARRDGAPIELSRINEHLAKVDRARTVPIRHPGPSGEPLTSWLFLPAHRSLAKVPLIVIPYPDTAFGEKPPAYQAPNQPLSNISAQVLAGRGNAVLFPSLPRPREPGRIADGLADQVLSIVGEALKNDEIDGTRLAVWGHSFGGYAAAIIATQTDRFRSIIASAGLFDLISARGTFLPSRRVHPEDGLSINTMAGWTETGQARLGGAPWAVPEAYVRNSPVFAANRVRTPMLFLQGDQDIAALSQAEEMFSTLYRQNKDAVLVTYWGEGHVVASPANLHDLYARVFDWLDKTLDGQPGGIAPIIHCSYANVEATIPQAQSSVSRCRNLHALSVQD